MGKTWHQEHFSCCKCSKNFSKAKLGYHEHEGYAYCETCYTEHALPKCQGCSKPITDKTIKALGGQWHISCLVCKVDIFVLYCYIHARMRLYIILTTEFYSSFIFLKIVLWLIHIQGLERLTLKGDLQNCKFDIVFLASN